VPAALPPLTVNYQTHTRGARRTRILKLTRAKQWRRHASAIDLLESPLLKILLRGSGQKIEFSDPALLQIIQQPVDDLIANAAATSRRRDGDRSDQRGAVEDLRPSAPSQRSTLAGNHERLPMVIDACGREIVFRQQRFDVGNVCGSRRGEENHTARITKRPRSSRGPAFIS